MSSVRYRIAVDFAKQDPETSIPDPKAFEPTDAHLAALADGVMIGIAYMLIQSGVRKKTDVVKYDLNSILREIPKLMMKLAGKGQFFRQEMMNIRRDGPQQYLNKISQKLKAL